MAHNKDNKELKESDSDQAASSTEDQWFDANKELPDEGLTVLVYLDNDHVTLGMVYEGDWGITIAPWEATGSSDDYEVVCWRYLPYPPKEMMRANEVH